MGGGESATASAAFARLRWRLKTDILSHQLTPAAQLYNLCYEKEMILPVFK